MVRREAAEPLGILLYRNIRLKGCRDLLNEEVGPRPRIWQLNLLDHYAARVNLILQNSSTLDGHPRQQKHCSLASSRPKAPP